MNPIPQTLDQALEELEDEAEDYEPLSELDFRRMNDVSWDILSDMGLDYE
jgi:hypothetical protein